LASKRERHLRKQQERRRRRKEQQRASGAHTSSDTGGDGRWEYPGPGELELAGPIILAKWEIPPVKAQALEGLGRPVPSPVTGYLLVDTGASSTCISEHAAQSLGLTPVSVSKGYGAGGECVHNVYDALLTLQVGTPDRKPMPLTSFRRVKGIPELDKHQCGLVGPDGKPVVLVGLLGRDFLRLGTLTYFGPKGVFELVVDPAQLAPAVPAPPLPSTSPAPAPMAAPAEAPHAGHEAGEAAKSPAPISAPPGSATPAADAPAVSGVGPDKTNVSAGAKRTGTG
jgi:hypothetical protein